MKGIVLDDFVQDARYALRSLARNPGFSAVAILTLALGIGANTTIFSVVYAVLLRPLPFPAADRLVTIVENRPASEPFDGRPARRPPSPEDLRELRSETKTLSGVYQYSGADPIRVPGTDSGPTLSGAGMTGDAMRSLGARAMLGRLFAADERGPVIVLSAEAWQRYFNSDPNIVGRVLEANSGNTVLMRTTQQYTVVGVLAPGFAFPNSSTAYWLARGGPLNVVRLKDDVSLEAAADEVSALLHRITSTPIIPATERAGPPRFELVPLQENIVARVRPTLRLLSVVAALVLLIVCANVANLLLARTTTRQREIAVRVAIGAGRGRLLRQTLTEGLVMSCLGGVAGTALARAGIQMLRSLFAGLDTDTLVRQVGVGPGVGPAFPRLDEIQIDAATLAFTLGVCFLTGVLFGIAPAVQGSFRSALDALRDGAATAMGGFSLGRRHSPRSALVVAQIALAMTLLVGGGLVVRSLANLLLTPKGFNPAGVVAFEVRVPRTFRTAQHVRDFAERFVESLRAVPGVRAAAYGPLPLVMRSQNLTLRLSPNEQVPQLNGPGTSIYQPDLRLVSRHYLETVGTRVTRGAGFIDPRSSGRRVVLINETLARSRFGGENPVGRQVYIALGPGRDAEPWEIAGVVEDVRQVGLDIEPTPQIFADFGSWPRYHEVFDVPTNYMVRTDADLRSIVPAIRNHLARLEPDASVEQVTTMGDMVSTSLARPRMYAILLGIFAAVGLVLATIGVYAVMTYAVAQSTRELGVRLALGARRREILTLVLGRAGVLASIGIAIGVLGAWGVTRYLQGMLFGLTPTDATTFIACAALFAFVALLASYVPARRAMRVDPLAALRSE